MGLFRRKNVKLNVEKLPYHIAFIIDGNGRWAKEKGMPRTYGHKVGVEAVKNTVNNCLEIGIKQLSFYCFSTENWNRPKDEIDAIFDLMKDYLEKFADEYVNKGIKLYVSGDITKLPTDLQEKIVNIVDKTKDNDNMMVNICLNYGGRAEIVRAVNTIINEKIENVTEKSFKNYLYTKDFKDPDLIVRTSGENRISNFMLYQLAYSEFYFPKTYWPDFDKKELIKALNNYAKRTRKFGSIKQ